MVELVGLATEIALRYIVGGFMIIRDSLSSDDTIASAIDSNATIDINSTIDSNLTSIIQIFNHLPQLV